jgi:signal transduction histidine kinase
MSGARPRSLRWRLLAATLAAAAAALALAGVVLAGLLRAEVLRQFDAALTAQLDQVTARLEFDAEGRPQLEAATLSDPRWSRPYSGLYWQVDGRGPREQAAVLRSRSLWDAALTAPADELPAAAVHVHEIPGPKGARLRLVERTVRAPVGHQAADEPAWRLLVAADLGETQAAIARFNSVLAASLAVLLALLGGTAWWQVRVGLAPLGRLRLALARLREGQAARLEGRFPAEVQGLVDDFNAVLARNTAVVERARTQAGNLAHALKTPLATLLQAAEAAPTRPQALAALPLTVREQVVLARRHVDWHLARARAAAAQGLPGTRTEAVPVLEGLARAMRRLHAARGLEITVDGAGAGAGPAFAGESQDLHEMLGNLMDNACQWARTRVEVHAGAVADGAATRGPRLHIVIDDDGPGIPEAQRAQALARGGRLDESTPGSGLGLAIVQELAALYGGRLGLQASPWGGLRAVLELPAAPPPAASASAGRG